MRYAIEQIPVFPAEATAANLLIPERFSDAAFMSENWYVHYPLAGSLHMGCRETFARKEGINAHAVTELGRMVPANYYPFTPDADGGGISVGTNSEYRYQGLGAGEWISWDVPASAAGHDKLELHFWRPYGASSFIITIERDAESIAVGTFPDDVITYAVGSSLVIDLPVSLQAGDAIKILQTGSTSSIFCHSITTYHSTGVVTSQDQHMKLIGTLTTIMQQNSVPETVNKVAPTGLTPKTIGGLHQGGDDNCTQENVVNTFWVNGSIVALAQGWMGGRDIKWKRTSTVKYNDENANIASMVEYWRLNGRAAKYVQDFIAAVPLDAATRYPLMCPIPVDQALVLFTDAYNLDLANIPAQKSIYLSDGIKTVKVATKAGAKVCMQVASGEGMVDDFFVTAVDSDSNGAVDYLKVYSDLGSYTNQQINQSTSMSMWFEV